MTALAIRLLACRAGDKPQDILDHIADLYGTHLSYTVFSQYTQPILLLIYHTNTVEGIPLELQKVTKIKEIITSDIALLKLVYLATKKSKRNGDIATVQQLAILYGDRLLLEINRRTEFSLHYHNLLLAIIIIVPILPFFILGNVLFHFDHE